MLKTCQLKRYIGLRAQIVNLFSIITCSMCICNEHNMYAAIIYLDILTTRITYIVQYVGTICTYTVD